MKFTLVNHCGDYDEGTACLMSAAVAKFRLSQGEELGEATDRLSCVCPVIRSFSIQLNDCDLWKSDNHRTEVLTPYIDRIIGTRERFADCDRIDILVNYTYELARKHVPQLKPLAQPLNRLKVKETRVYREYISSLRLSDPLQEQVLRVLWSMLETYVSTFDTELPYYFFSTLRVLNVMKPDENWISVCEELFNKLLEVK